jgi:nucleotide-binding universal stress UspA family protein
MKILIATDGSKCADEAQSDLVRAGMPANAEAIVLSVADVWLPPSDVETGLPEELKEVAQKARARGEEALSIAQGNAEAGASTIRQLFPSWKVQGEATADSPGWGIISRAEHWPADLIVVGSQGLSGIGKLIQGSVSQKVVTHAHCPVRIGRPAQDPERKQIRLMIGIDGSSGSIRAVDHVTQRSWPRDTEIHLIAVLDPRFSTAAISYLPQAAQWIQEGYQDEEAWIRGVMEKESKKIKDSGLHVTTSIQQGDPKYLIIEFSRQWEADTIFVGARGLTRVERFLMGSVSGAVASRAHCSVEVVHRFV